MFEETSRQVRRPFRGQVFDVEVHEVTLPDGKTGKRELVRHAGGACVLALDEQGRVPMVRQYRKAFEHVLLEVPAGKLEVGEDPLACAQRELQEETGVVAAHYRKLGTLYPSPGYCSEQLHLYLATGLTTGPARPDAGEFVSCEWVPFADLIQAIEADQIRDAKTVVALLMAARQLTDHPSMSQEGGRGGGV